MKCPFCQHPNEEGVLFCEQCKSDLGILEPTPFPDLQAAVAEAMEIAPARQAPTDPVIEEIVVAGLTSPPADVPATELPVGEVVASEPAADTAGPIAETVDVTPPPIAAESPLAPSAGMAAQTFDAAALAALLSADGAMPITAAALPPRLVVTRGQKVNEEFPLFEGENYIGRADEKPVDIDLEHQEHPERIWSSRQHAVITLENGKLTIEDLNSSNGTFVNRSRITSGDKQPLKPGDVIQVGTVQLKVKA